MGALAAVLAWVRLDGPSRGAVWAEDGGFLQDRLDHGPLVTLLDPYQGYLHLLPRAVVEVAVLVPLRDYAVAVTALCCLVVGGVAALVHACSRDVLDTQAARVAVALVTVLVPTGAAELLGNAANLHWFLLWLTPWVLLFRPTAAWQGWALGALLLVVGLTEVQAVYFLPLVFLAVRDRRRWPVAAGLLAGTSAQVLVALTSYRDPDSGTPSLLDLLQGYGLHVFLQTWRPATAGVGQVLVERGWAVVVAAAAPFVLVLVVLVVATVRAVVARRPAARQDAVLLAVLLAGALAPYVVAMVLNFRPFLAFSELGLETLAVFAPLRYAVVPAMFVLAAVALAADRLVRGAGRGGAVTAGVLLLGLLGLGVAHLDAGPTFRSEAPGWSAAVDRAEERCRRGDLETVTIRIAPVTWAVTLPCTVLTPRGGQALAWGHDHPDRASWPAALTTNHVGAATPPE